MNVTVDEILKRNIFDKCTLIAGKKGVKNIIKSVGILDYEIENMDNSKFDNGEFLITSLLEIKNKPEMLEKIVFKLVELGVSGLAIKKIYYKNISDNVKKIADKNSFPIIMFEDTFFENIIIKIDEINKEKKICEKNTNLIKKILKGEYRDNHVEEIAKNININFCANCFVAYFKLKNKRYLDVVDKVGRIVNLNYSSIIMYKEGFLLIYTSEKKNFELNNLIGNISKIYSEDTILGIGVSMKYNSLEKLYYAINESLFSYYYSMINDRKTSYYDELGLYQILLPNIKNKWIEKFYNSRIKKIIDYDLKNKTGLIDTIDAFVNNNGNYKKTAYETSQHINTVRYRIDKVYSLIGQGKHFEILAIIMFFHKIMLFDEENNLF